MIARRIEAPDHREPAYTKRELTADAIERGAHRKWVGGRWEGHGRRQLQFLQEQGLKPHHRLLDIGCGSLRAGRHFIEYLDSDMYYGMDANHSVLQAGYEHELTDELKGKVPETNLRSSDRFDVDFGVQFDLALAQSVFTHVSLNHIRLCFYRLAQVMAVGGRFYATILEPPPGLPIDGTFGARRPRYNERNVYWYYPDDIYWAASFSGWRPRYIGEWGHPRGQTMIEFTQVSGSLSAANLAVRHVSRWAASDMKKRARVLARRARSWARS